MTYLPLGDFATFFKQLHSLSSFLDTFWFILEGFLGSWMCGFFSTFVLQMCQLSWDYVPYVSYVTNVFVYSHIYPGTCPKNVTNYLVSTYHVYHVYHVPYASYVTDVFVYSHICPGIYPKNVTNFSLSLSLFLSLSLSLSRSQAIH